MRTLDRLIIFVAIVISALRPLLVFYTPNDHVQSSYEAIAHLFVGGLFTAWYMGKDKGLLVIALLLTAVEVVCATIGALT